ncbi:MAG: ABC transporter ATP-binding protein [Candidatus Eremiobacteraeota bacterium]|nr:ABC transporter ATP-binding protein [Candidatus Eremiobacteraeota bacterium]
MNAAVVLDAISKRYAGNPRATIESLSLSVEAGEFVVLLGPSGCGKSTVLRLIAGLIAPSSGRISIDGNDVTDGSPKERNVAMVFQNYALFPHLTVYENLAFGMRIRGGTSRAKIDAAVRAAAKATGLTELLERKPKELSGGQSQRVALGRALVREPAAFLFDEPLSNLDPDLRGRMRAEIAVFRRRVRGAMIYVTHDQLEAMTLADRIVVLDGGIVQQIGPPLDVYNEPANRFVASFLGATPMNFMSARDARRLSGVAPSAGSNTYDDDVTVGVRPEDVYLAERIPAGVTASAPFEATVDLFEALGDGAILHCTVLGVPLVARLRHQYRPRDRGAINLAIDLQRLHEFDARGDRLPQRVSR